MPKAGKMTGPTGKGGRMMSVKHVKQQNIATGLKPKRYGGGAKQTAGYAKRSVK